MMLTIRLRSGSVIPGVMLPTGHRASRISAIVSTRARAFALVSMVHTIVAMPARSRIPPRRASGGSIFASSRSRYSNLRGLAAVLGASLAASHFGESDGTGPQGRGPSRHHRRAQSQPDEVEARVTRRSHMTMRKSGQAHEGRIEFCYDGEWMTPDEYFAASRARRRANRAMD